MEEVPMTSDLLSSNMAKRGKTKSDCLWHNSSEPWNSIDKSIVSKEVSHPELPCRIERVLIWKRQHIPRWH
jgi:hypothetical protein